MAKVILHPIGSQVEETVREQDFRGLIRPTSWCPVSCTDAAVY